MSNVIACMVDISFPESLLTIGEITKKDSCAAIWDTGATNSAITELEAKKLNLVPTGIKNVSGLGGTIPKNTYLIDILLKPANILIRDLSVTELDNPVNELGVKTEQFGILIGMDIIARGDFCITHTGNKTMMSFRIPSIVETDYVAEWNRRKAVENKYKRK